MKCYTMEEAAEILKITRRTLDKWKDKGIIKVMKIGNVVRVSQEELERLLRGE